ncbi:pilus (MSHA type) biogenesis protein MshL [Inhella gelatinilytica]|uniref:Pilus (MSHA type) biogenesis protein MshL n=1 Tax=Inhella gelatinilytica TaxID=2795030 RepID=A0A931IWH1_9BURK|nr:pilus (MSHA type) biogenesis protein MshL [Inhella gelatinilytica]MBH9551333.1 pilus (MSHA type) biogenesis protein MshL [Inhella gelatinilytica]
MKFWGPLSLALALGVGVSPGAWATTALSAAPTANAKLERFDIALVDAPAAQVFLQIAQGSPYQLLVAPEVTGRISLNLKQTTVLEALEAIKELYGYDYKVLTDKVYVYSNAIQTRIFRINYLPGRRQGESDTRVSTSALAVAGATSGGNSGGGSGGSNGGGAGGSSALKSFESAQVRTTSDANFWSEVRESLALLVGSSGGRSVVLNPSAGVIVVRAPGPELVQVEQYLQAIQVSIERQVMLEAKILEVSLSDDAKTGINWGAFGQLLGGARGGQLAIGVGQPGAVISPTGTALTDGANVITPGAGGAINLGAMGRGFYGLAFQATNFAALLNFLESQGDVHVLSSPRIATLNNQKALLKVGSDELYVTGISNSNTNNSSSNNTGSSTSPAVPTLQFTPFFSGIVLDVTPQIDAQGQVMLHVHPSISLVNEREKILNLGLLGNFRLPLATSSINETDSIVRVADGQIVAIGGLMTQELRGDRTGLPVLSNLPVVGNLFGQTQRVNRKRELVILIKPTVIPADGRWPAELSAPALPAPPTPQRTAP